jgi:ketosteroid isomerase-like protein
MSEFSQAEMRNVEQACYALAIEYAEIIDSQDYARLVEVFAEDATFLGPMAPKEPIHGADKIVAMFQSRPRNRLTQHLISNFRVRMETMDSAVGTCRVLFFSSDVSEPETAEGRKAADKQSIGTYQDRYVRTKNGWRIAERIGTMIFYT